MLRALILLALSCLLSPAFADERAQTQQQLDAAEVGKTTQDDVRGAFGAPSRREQLGVFGATPSAQQEGEGPRQAHPDDAPSNGLTEARGLLFLAENPQVQGQHDADEGKEG